MDDLARELGHGPGRGAAAQPAPEVRRAARGARRACSTTPATTSPACARRWGWSTTTPSAPSRRPPRVGRPRADRHRDRQLHRERGAVAVEGRGRGAAAERRLGGGHGADDDVSGKVEVVTGTSPHGQGHETAWSQIAADALGVHPDDVEVLHGDTAIAPFGRDTYGSRSLARRRRRGAPGGGEGRSTRRARIAAHLLEAAEEDIEFDGRPVLRGRHDRTGRDDPGDRAGRVARRDLPEGMEPNLTADHAFDPPNFTWPFGTHICVDRGRHRDRLRPDPPLRRRRRLRARGEPDDRRGPAARRHRAGHRAGALRARHLRRRRATRRRLRSSTYTVPAATRPAALRARPDRHPVADEPDGRQGDRRVRGDRLVARRGQRRDRRRRAPRRHPRGHAGHPAGGVAGDQGRGGPGHTAGG